MESTILYSVEVGTQVSSLHLELSAPYSVTTVMFSQKMSSGQVKIMADGVATRQYNVQLGTFGIHMYMKSFSACTQMKQLSSRAHTILGKQRVAYK